MFLSEPAPTDYDLKFSLFGFPVRTHPLFFIAPLLFGRGLIPENHDSVGVAILIITAVFFVSILLHELGHSLAFKYYGIDSRIVLHWMGGLAIPDRNNPWKSGTGNRLSSNGQMVVSFAGPLSNILQALAMVGIGWALGGEVFIRSFLIPMPLVDFSQTAFAGNQNIFLLFTAMIVLNLFWALLNLMPVFPLDGGQIARAFLNKIDPRDGIRNATYLSIGTATLLALYGVTTKSTFMVIFFGFMAYSSWQMLQSYRGPRW